MKFSTYQRLNQLNQQALTKARLEILQERADGLNDGNLVTGFEVKIGTFLKNTAIINNEKEIDCIIEYERMKEKVYNSNSRRIMCYPNEIKTGDYVTIYTEQGQVLPQSKTYIIRSAVDNKIRHDQAFMVICQQRISFLSNGEVVTFPAYFNESRSKMTETRDKSPLVDDAATYEMYVQYNNHTRLITESDEFAIGRVNRFIIKNRAYRVMGIDDVSMEGLMCIKIKIDKVSPMDNLENNVADYFKHIEEVPNEVDPSMYTIEGDNEIYINDSAEYTLVGVNENDVVEWSVTPILEDIKLIANGSNIKIEVAKNLTLKNKKITLKATVNKVEYIKEIKIINW